MTDLITGTIVACTRKVKATNSDKVGTVVAWNFDFEDCPIEKIYELAIRSLVIDVQREYRTAKPAERKALINKDFSVLKMLATRKKKADPVKKAKAAMAALSEKDLADVLAMHKK